MSNIIKHELLYLTGLVYSILIDDILIKYFQLIAQLVHV